MLIDVLGQAGVAELSSDAALLDAAEGHPQVQRLERVGVDEGAGGARCSRATAAVTVVIERYLLECVVRVQRAGQQLLQVADRVFFDVLTHACLAELAPDAAFLHPAEGHAQVERLESVAVDEGATRLDLAGDGETSFGVGRPDR